MLWTLVCCSPHGAHLGHKLVAFLEPDNVVVGGRIIATTSTSWGAAELELERVLTSDSAAEATGVATFEPEFRS